jgi:hypothetical protein
MRTSALCAMAVDSAVAYVHKPMAISLSMAKTR